MSDVMTVPQFAAKVKAQYPDYANIPDDELTRKILDKHPEYRDQVSFGAGGSWEAQPGALSRAVSAAGEWVKGVLQAGPNAVHNEAVPVDAQGVAHPPTFSSMRDELVNFGRSLVGQHERDQGNDAGANTKTALNLLSLVGAERAAAKASPEVPTAGSAAPREGILRKGGRIVTQSGERQTEKFVKDTINANQEAEAKAAEQTAKEQAAYQTKFDKTKKTVEESNATKMEAHAKKVAEIEKANTEAAQDHAREVIRVESLNEATRDQVGRRGALARGVKTLSDRLLNGHDLNGEHVPGLKDLDKQVRAEANAKYNAVRAQIGTESVPLDDLVRGVNDAKAKLKGSQENIREFNDILGRQEGGDSELGNLRQSVSRDQFRAGYGDLSPERQSTVDDLIRRISNGEPPTDLPSVPWGDLQGYYSELGAKLSTGKLSGDVYQALKSLQKTVGDSMQKVADAKGVGSDFRDARKFYREYMETFNEPSGPSGSGSPVAKAVRAADADYAAGPFLGKSGARGLEMLSKYSPDLTSKAKALRDAAKEMESIKPGKEKPLPERPGKKPVPEAPKLREVGAPNPPNPIQPEITKVGPEELQQSKREAVLKEAQGLSKTGTWLLPFAALHGVMAALSGNMQTAMFALADIPVYMGGREAVVKIMEKPRVVEWLSRPSPQDLKILEKLPPKYRTQAAQRIGQVVKAATERNLQVDPGLTAFAATYAGSQSNRKDLIEKGHAIAQP